MSRRKQASPWFFVHGGWFMNSVSMAVAMAPVLLMLAAALLPRVAQLDMHRVWRSFTILSALALVASVLAIFSARELGALQPWLHVSTVGLILAVLVQLLGTVIGVFSARYLDGEPGQRGYVAALSGVLAAVQLLLLADHWVVLIAAWALVGTVLQRLLCFYPDRPFALLAAHKKRMADRLADVLLISAAALAWQEVGSGSLSALWAYIEQGGWSPALQASAVCLVLGVILRTALLPVHGWLIQVMEAPTPVSALLHAGVVNLGGFVLIRFAPLLEQAVMARWLLVAFGLATAVLAGMVMLTRISIKVRLAWSTVAQMGFMVLECGLGLYTLALLHMVGHSLYKAHTFLAASSVVRETRLQMMRGVMSPRPFSLLLAPALAIPVVLAMQHASGGLAWPWWWSVILGFAWAPLLWLPGAQQHGSASIGRLGLAGLLAVIGLTAVMLVAHALPLGLRDAPDAVLGVVALVGMSLLYLCLVVLHLRPAALARWRRWSYAGFYVDESFTRLTLRLWPASWTAQSEPPLRPQATTVLAKDAAQ